MDVELSSPVVSIGGGGAGATKLPVLGDLRSCRVVRLDLNSFPYDVEDLEDSSQVIVGFLVFLWSSFHSEVKWALLFRLVPGCAFMINQSITFRLIDRITESDPSNITRVEQITILSLAAGFFVVYLVEMWADIAFGKLRLKGKGGIKIRINQKSQLLTFCLFLLFLVSSPAPSPHGCDGHCLTAHAHVSGALRYRSSDEGSGRSIGRIGHCFLDRVRTLRLFGEALVHVSVHGLPRF